MKIKILSEKENPVLDRKEMMFEVTFTGGIKSMREIRKEVLSTLKSKDELTILNGLKTRFGERRAEVYVKVYKNKKALEVEPKFRLKKNFKEEKKEVKEKAPKEKPVIEKEAKEKEKSNKEKAKEMPKAEKSIEAAKSESKKESEVKNG